MESEIEDKELAMPFFLSCFSHEIRTPLNGVVGYSQLLTQTNLSTVQKGYVSSMNKCCLQLMELINNVIDYSKLAVGKMKKQEECFSLYEVSEVVNNTMGIRLQQKRQKCHYVISRNLPKYIVSDKQKIIQILINLVSNANKFTDVGGFISVHISPKQENIIEFTVKDNGVGISLENQEKLFTTFFQVQESMGKEGSGLGLVICKKLSMLLGGDIHVNSIIGKGSTFSFTIQYEPHLEFERKIARNINNLRGKYVLVINENIDNRIVIGEHLFEWRMKPIVCASMTEAMRLLDKNRYNFSLAIIDISMPGISSTDIARRIKLNLPMLPLIGLSSTEFYLPNFECVLKNPINKTQLLTEIQKIFERGINSIKLQTNEDDDLSDNESISCTSKDVKILIAENIPHNMDLLCKILQSMDYKNIDTAVNGKIALEKIAESKEEYDILFLDLRMPVLDGFDVIKALNKQGKSRPMISVVTASVLESDKTKCKKLGITYFVTKPYNVDQIRSVMTCIPVC